MAGLVLVNPPGVEPVSLDESKVHCRVTFDSHDALLTDLIQAAREHVEDSTRRALVEQQWRLTLDGFPSCDAPIEFPLGQFRELVSIEYVDTDGNTQTLGASAYQLDADSEPARLVPAYGESWPSTREVLAAVRIVFTCGWADENAVPRSLKQMVLLLIGHWYMNPEAVVTGTIATEVQLAFDRLAAANRLPRGF